MSQEYLPLISVIVAVYNGAATLQQCIDSIVQQTYPNKELIIVDGGSKDGTVDLLKANEGYFSYWISEPDRGIYNAWNKGLRAVKGQWICFLGADDFFWNETVLESMVQWLIKLPPTINVAYGQVMLLNLGNETLYPVGSDWQYVKNRFKQIMSIPHPGAMHRRSLFERYGGFDESFYIAGDYELLLRELKSEDAFFIPNLIAVGMRQGGISTKPDNAILQLHEIRRAQKLHGQRLPGPVWLMALVKVYVRVLLWNVLGEKFARRLLDIVRCSLGLPPFWTKT